MGKLGVGYLQGNDKSYVYSVAPTLVIGAGSVETVNVTSTGLSVTGTITGSSNLILNTAIAGENNINFTSNSLLRWQFTKIGSAETGSNAGADFAIYRYTDAGAFLGTPFAITRSTGAVTIGGNLTLGGTGIFEIPVNGYIVVPESGTPAPGGGNQARIFAVDNGAGKTILRVQFGSGAAQTIATEP